MPRKGLVSRQYQYELPRFGVTEDGPRVQRRRVVAVLWVMALAVAVVLFISGPQGIMDTFTNLFNSKDGDPERDPQKPVGQRAAGLPLQKFAGVRPILLLKESTSRHQPDGTPKVDVYKRDIRLKARQVVKTLIVDRKSTVISMKRVTTKKYTPQPTPPSYKRFDFPTEKPGFNQTGFRKAVVVAGPGGNPTKAIQDKIDECSVQMRDPKYRICVITLSKAFCEPLFCAGARARIDRRS